MGSLERTGPARCLPVGEALSCERGPCAMLSPGVLPASPHQGLLHGSRLGIHFAQCLPHRSVG